MYHPIVIPAETTPVPPAAAACARPACPVCGKGDAVIKHGTSAGLRRWRCKACSKTFSPKTFAQIAQETRFDAIVRADLLSDFPGTCRELAKTLGVSPETANRYRHRVMATLPPTSPALLTGLRKAAVFMRRENRKGERKGDAGPRGQDAVLVVVLADGGLDLTRLTAAEARLAGAHDGQPTRRMVRLSVIDGTPVVAVRTAVGGWRRLHLEDLWQVWFVSNRGPASGNLDLYLRWFAAWLTRP